jgi:hypothetical protein
MKLIELSLNGLHYLYYGPNTSFLRNNQNVSSEVLISNCCLNYTRQKKSVTLVSKNRLAL